MVKPYIVHYNDDFGTAPVGVEDFFQVAFKALIIALLMKAYRDLPCFKVIAAHGRLPLSPPLLAFDLRLDSLFVPFVAYGSRIGQRKPIFKKQNSVDRTFKGFFLKPP